LSSLFTTFLASLIVFKHLKTRYNQPKMLIYRVPIHKKSLFLFLQSRLCQPPAIQNSIAKSANESAAVSKINTFFIVSTSYIIFIFQIAIRPSVFNTITFSH